MNNRIYCLASGTVFAIVALMHIWRFVMDLPLQIGVWHVSRSLSLIAAIGAGLLAVWAFNGARTARPPETVYT
jgi:predicted lysophospholipase L1 biosynthesis ABC-type transport system permease subunit